MLVVLFAAVLHASWNAIIKAGSEKFLDTALVSTGAAFVAAIMLPLEPLPARANWLYVGASVAIHCVYFSFVAALRETTVIFATLIAATFLHERFGATRYLAAGMVSVGVAAMKVF